MDSTRFASITARYADLTMVVVGDFCLDRYLEIDPGKEETSIETGLQVHNVVNVRAQPGGAGTILNNLAALGIGSIYPIGFCGEDGEGFELERSLAALPGVSLTGFLRAPQRRTFTYCKPLVLTPGQPPQELNRLDSKNWNETPEEIEQLLVQRLDELAPKADAVIVLDQVDLAESGVVTQALRKALAGLQERRPKLPILADSRRGLIGFPPVTYKMNAAELTAMLNIRDNLKMDEAKAAAAALARRNGRRVYVTLSERGLLGATQDGHTEHIPVLSLRGEIDIVGAGDAVSANLAAAEAAGGDLRECLEIANAAASVVIHKLGTTGTASVAEIRELLCL